MTPLRVLFISPYLPSLIRVRPYNLIKALAGRGHQITLLALVPPNEDTNGLASLHAWCSDIQTVPLPRWRTLWNALRALPSRTPLQAAYSRSPEMSTLIRRIQAQEHFDVVHLEHLRGAELASPTPPNAHSRSRTGWSGHAVNGVPILFDSVDSITLLFEQACRSAPSWRSRLIAGLDLARTRGYESCLLERYARVLVTSPRDKEALASLSTIHDAEERLVVLPNGVDLDYFRPLDAPRDPATLIFTGKMSYHANVAAALDLATQVMPYVWASLPDARLVIAGKDPGPELLALTADTRISVTGTLPDLRPHLAKASLAVLPIRYGVGIQNKLLEAMAMATPVVSTSQATSALQVEPGRDLFVADTPQAIAQAVTTLLADASLRHRIGQAGRRYVEAHHNWDVAAGELEKVYREIIAEMAYPPAGSGFRPEPG